MINFGSNYLSLSLSLPLIYFTSYPINIFSFLKLEGNQGIDINATSGNLAIDSLSDVKIQSRKGKVRSHTLLMSF